MCSHRQRRIKRVGGQLLRFTRCHRAGNGRAGNWSCTQGLAAGGSPESAWPWVCLVHGELSLVDTVDIVAFAGVGGIDTGPYPYPH